MRRLILLLLVPGSLFAANVPLQNFDQSKLENLLRKIPAALVQVKREGEREIRHYRYPSEASLFSIHCEGQHFGGAPLPTYKSCTLTVETGERGGMKGSLRGDEYALQIHNERIVADLFEAISFGVQTKSLKASERVKGRSAQGNLKDLFRYSFECQAQICELRMTTLPPSPAVF